MVNARAVKQKGRTFENDVAEFLNEGGIFKNVERRRLQGVLDKGDLTNTEPFVVECKNTKKINLAEAVDEAEREAVNANQPYGVAVIKRPRKNVAQSYAVLSLATFVRLLGDLGVQTMSK